MLHIKLKPMPPFQMKREVGVGRKGGCGREGRKDRDAQVKGKHSVNFVKICF
jgi:hypothetical protein